MLFECACKIGGSLHCLPFDITTSDFQVVADAGPNQANCYRAEQGRALRNSSQPPGSVFGQRIGGPHAILAKHKFVGRRSAK